MNPNTIIIISILFNMFLLNVVIVTYWYGKKRERRLHIRLQNMLEDAIAGTFTESQLEESKVSELESSMWRFLNDCQVSSFHLKEQKKRIQALISDISHQTVTPISNIKIYTELLEEQQSIWRAKKNVVDKYMVEEMQLDMKEDIDAIKDQVEKLDFLIESLVKLSRLENGILSLKPQKSCIKDVLSAMKIQFANKAQNKNIALVIEDSKEEAEFDDKWTIEAIANIVDNAIKYTPEGGQVIIRVSSYSLFLRLDVIDTGIGIAEQEMGSIFTRFYRSPAVRTQPGVGIGLYLAREVLKMQKGYIKVSSKEGMGSTFSVFLYRG
jgi:signal transduction histidine kinase